MRVSFKIRNLLFGQNYDALELAQKTMRKLIASLHPAQKMKQSPVFEADDSPRALFFAAQMQGFHIHPSVEAAAHLGYSPAQAYMANLSHNTEKLKWASASAKQGDPQGLYQLGLCYLDLLSVDDARLVLLQAAKMGHVDALVALAPMLTGQDTFWFRQMLALMNNKIWSIFRPVFDQTVAERMCSFRRAAPDRLILSIGHLTGHYRMHSNSVSIPSHDLYCHVNHAVIMQKLYQPVREAIHAFALVAMRYRFYKDLRILIGQYMWTMRDEWIPEERIQKKTEKLGS